MCTLAIVWLKPYIPRSHMEKNPSADAAAVSSCQQEVKWWLLGLKPMSPQAVLGLFLEGIKSNWWGLACPHYCTQPSLGLLGFVFLLGWIVGIASTLAVLWWLSGCSGVVAADPSPGFPSGIGSRARVLAAYLHEPSVIQPRRRG